MQQLMVVTDEGQVADLLAVVSAANRRIAVEADRLSSIERHVSLATVARLNRLAEDLRPGALARAQLAEVTVDLLLAGTRLWLVRRRRDPATATATVTAAATATATAAASVRAAARWSGESA